MSEPLKELRNLSDAEIIQKHDQLAESTQVGVSHYLDEIARRDHDKQTETMLSYTRKMKHMTYAISIMTFAMMVLTIINVIAVFKA